MAKAAVRTRRSAARSLNAVDSRIDPTGAAAVRRKRLLEQARTEGLIGTSKDARISGRVTGSLIDAAKKRAQLSSDSDLIEYALLTVALQDDFGARLVRRKGSIATDIDLEC